MIISADQIENEISANLPIEAFETGLSKFPLLELTDEDFERLVYSLFKTSAPDGSTKDWDATALMVRGADAGRDILLTKAGLPQSVVQCKRLESALPLPAVFREISKLILFAQISGDLTFDRELDYYLAVARDPAGTVVDFVARRDELATGKTEDLKAAAREVRETYKTLAGLSIEEAEEGVLVAFPFLKLHLLRPGDINPWLIREKQVAGTFFRQHIVVDNSVVESGLAAILEQLGTMGTKLDGVSALTDEDVKITQDQIAGTPATHRLNLGIATLFGFPPEMFAKSEDLKARLDRIAKFKQSVTEDYISWVFGKSAAIAQEICLQPDLQSKTRMFARQIPAAFLGMVAKQCTEHALGSDVMGGIVRKLTGEPEFRDDEARLHHVCQILLETGERYLVRDFSQLQGDDDLVELKRRLVDAMMADIVDREALISALDDGKAVFRPALLKAADQMRELYFHRTSIVLTGTAALDNKNAVKRIADAAKMLDSLKKQV